MTVQFVEIQTFKKFALSGAVVKNQISKRDLNILMEDKLLGGVLYQLFKSRTFKQFSHIIRLGKEESPQTKRVSDLNRAIILTVCNFAKAFKVKHKLGIMKRMKNGGKNNG